MLDAPGRKLTRDRFVSSAERASRFYTGILPPFGFTRTDHFGGGKTHVLEADCKDERWRTIRRFVSDF